MIFEAEPMDPTEQARFLEAVLTKQSNGGYIITANNAEGFRQNYRPSEIEAYTNKYLEGLVKNLKLSNAKITHATIPTIAYNGIVIGEIDIPRSEITDEQMIKAFTKANQVTVDAIGEPELHDQNEAPKAEMNGAPTELQRESKKFTQVLGSRSAGGWKIPG